MNPPQPGAEALNHDVIRAALRGDEAAFEEVIRLYSRKLYAIAFGIVQSSAEAEDIVQESFLAAHRNRWRLRNPASFPAWICMVARNRARDVLRKRTKLGRHPSEDDPHFEQQDDSVPAPSGALEQGEREKTIKLLLASLPEQWRAAVTLRYLEGMDHSSIEQELKLSNGALRGILGRAMGRLRREARQHLGDFNN